MEFAQTRARHTQAPGGLFDEMFCQQGHVLFPLTQRRHFDGKDAEPIVQVETKAPGFGFAEEVAIGGRDKTCLHGARAVIAEALELSFLQHAQQFALQVGRDFANFITQQRAAIRQFESPHTVLDRSGECAAHMPEKFALEQLFWNEGTVDAHQRVVFARAQVMNGAGHQFLPYVGFVQAKAVKADES